LPSADAIKRSKEQRAELLQNAIGSLRPEEPSWLDAAIMGIGSYGKPVEQGQVGAALGAMGAGAVRARQEMQTREQQKAATAFGLADKEFDQQQKMAADALSKGQSLELKQQQMLARQQAGSKGTILDPLVNSVDKFVSTYGSQLVPEEKAKLWAKTFMERAPIAVESWAIQNKLPKEEAAVHLQRLIEMMPQRTPADFSGVGAATTTTTGAVAPPPAASPPPPSTTGTTIPYDPTQDDTKTITTKHLMQGDSFENLDTSSTEAYDMLRASIAQASRNGNREAVTALQAEMLKQFPNGKPQTPASQVSVKPTAPTQPTGIVSQDQAEIQKRLAIAQGESNIKMGDAARIAAETTGSELGAKLNAADFEKVQSHYQTLPKIDVLINHLESSDALTGMGAELIKEFERAKAMFGDKIANKVVSDTEWLNALTGSEVFPLISSLGIGARGLDTLAEKEFLREVMTGAITMNKETLSRMARARREEATKSINNWNSRLKKGELNNFYRRIETRRNEARWNYGIPGGS
jgi:hypothetical protein